MDSLNSLNNFNNLNKKVTNLSLAEKRKLQEQAQQSKLQKENEKLNEHYDQSHFWDSLEGKGSNLLGNGRSGISNQRSSQQTGDIFDDILLGTNQPESTSNSQMFVNSSFF